MKFEVQVFRRNYPENNETLIHVNKYSDLDGYTNFTREDACDLLEDLVVEGICNEDDTYCIVSPFLKTIHWGKRVIVRGKS